MLFALQTEQRVFCLLIQQKLPYRILLHFACLYIDVWLTSLYFTVFFFFALCFARLKKNYPWRFMRMLQQSRLFRLRPLPVAYDQLSTNVWHHSYPTKFNGSNHIYSSVMCLRGTSIQLVIYCSIQCCSKDT